MGTSYWIETLGCPKNQVDSDKLTGTLLADGLVAASSAGDADLVVVMAEGGAVEQGSHAELLARDGLYARLVRSQSLLGQ